MPRFMSCLSRAALILLFAAALWMRTTSLESLPDLNGDEVWHAIQITHLLRGEPFTLFTATNLPLSPFHAALELPFLAGLRPSLWLVRLPALITGILAIILTYVLGSKILDRTTALIAAALLAVLPIAVIYSRVSYESSHAPLMGIVVIYLAYRLRTAWLVPIVALGYFVHPISIFLLPEVIVLIVVQSLKETSVEPSRRWRRLLARVGALSATGLAMGLFTMSRPSTQKMSKAFDTGLWGRHDFLEFGSSVERFFLGDNMFDAPARSWLFWSAVAVLYVLGLRQLVRSRSWDRLTFACGPVLCALALFVFGGSKIISPSMTRYGLFLITPTAVAFACLFRSLLVEPLNARRALARELQVAGALGVGWVLLLSLDLTCLNKWSYTYEGHRNQHESAWTFGRDALPPAAQVSRWISRDLDGDEAARRPDGDKAPATGRERRPTVVVSEIFWVYGPVEWLLIPRRDITFLNFHESGDDYWPKIARTREALHGGGYAVCYPTTVLDSVVRSYYSPAMLSQREFRQNGDRHATVYRLSRSIPVPGDYDGDGRTDPAVYRPLTAEWVIPALGDEPVRVGVPGRDVPVPGDYDGDGRTDLAVYRPSTGEWVIPRLGDRPSKLGEPGQDVPVPGDYDGDGRTDLAVFHPRTGAWTIPCLGPQPIWLGDWGRDLPVPGDYNGDGRTDPAIFRLTTAQWVVPCLGPNRVQQFGAPGRDVPMPADYDGDGRTDLAVHRPSTAEWYLRSADGGVRDSQFGQAGLDKAIPGDYDGDGTTDLAVYSASTGAFAWRTSVGQLVRQPPDPRFREAPAGRWPAEADIASSRSDAKTTRR